MKNTLISTVEHCDTQIRRADTEDYYGKVSMINTAIRAVYMYGYNINYIMESLKETL